MRIFALTVIVAGGVCAGQLDWFIYQNVPGAQVVTETDPVSGAEVIRFQYCRGEKPYALIIANEEPALQVTAQHKLVFWIRGDPGNGGTRLETALSVPNLKKSYRPGPSVKTESGRWRRYVFSLNTDFGLPDALHTVSQLKFSLGMTNCKVGDTARVWIRDVAIVEAGDLSLGDVGREFAVNDVWRKVLPPIALPTVRVFSDMDNEDRTSRIHSAKYSSGIPEPVSGPGYRHLLTHPLESCVTQVDSLRKGADVMVVCRSVQGSTPVSEVEQWVQSGGGLLLYGACTGYDKLLPGKYTVRPRGGQRQRLTLAKPEHPLFTGIKLKEDVTLVPFGSFEPNTEATVLATFVDGTPAVVTTASGHGRVLFLNFGPGKNLTPASELYDELALRAIYWLTRRPDAAASLPEIDRQLVAARTTGEAQIVNRTLTAADIADSSGWRLGMSEDNVSRFGWAIDEGLLVGNVNRHLQLTCGETSVGFSFSRKEGAQEIPRSTNYEVLDVNWVCKTARVGIDGHFVTMHQSLLSPFLHYDTKEEEIRLTFGHMPAHAAFPTGDEVVTRSLDNTDSLAEFANSASPGWLLVWEDDVSHPVLLVFQNRVALSVVVEDGAASGLVVRGSDGVGTFLVGHPFGLEKVDAGEWLPELPQNVVERIQFWHRACLAFPVGCDEIFRLDRAANRVRIVNHFRFLTVEDAWGTRPSRLAPLPPLVSFALDQGLLVTDCLPVKDINLPTKYGPFRVSEDSDVVSYSLPMVPEEHFAYVNSVDEPELSAYINNQFENGVHWSCGGHVHYEDWTVEAPRKGLEFRNIDPFAWGFGLVTALQGRVFLNDINRNKLAERVNRRFSDPVERHQYKMLARYREEPFSGIRYPVFFNSIYPNKTQYAGDFGSRVIYGDENEASTLMLMAAYLNAVQLGDVGLIRANWNFFRQAARMILTTDDWAAHASGCREYSAGVWLDMLNCEYPGMVHYARVAEIAGDRAAAEQGYYRAAKRMLPTVMRLYFHDYVNRHQLCSFPARVVFGFNEPDGAVAATARIDGFNCEGAMDLTDFSQATCFALLSLYATQSPDAVKTYLEKIARPSFLRDGKWRFRFPYLKVFAFFGAEPTDLRAMVHDIDEGYGKRLRNDWPGMRQCDEVGAAIFRMHPDVYVVSHAPAALCDAVYADAAGHVTLILDSPTDGVPFKLRCCRSILSVECDGNALPRQEWSHEDGIFSVSLAKGRSQWFLRLGDRITSVRGLFPVQ